MTTPFTTAPELAIPPEPCTQADINRWYELQEQLAIVKDAEMTLRKKIFAFYFQAPKEGTNTFPLSDGWVMKGGYKIDRKVDEAVLLALGPELRDAGVVTTDLVRYKPELSTTEYRKLTEAQLAVFNQALVIKPGSPSLEIVKPRRAG